MAQHPQLRYGSHGEAVRDLQARLHTLGFDLGHTGPKHDGVDGVFKSRTRDAVKAFQDRKHIQIDGVVGPQTWGALDGDAPASAGARPKVIPGKPAVLTVTRKPGGGASIEAFFVYKTEKGPPGDGSQPDAVEVEAGKTVTLRWSVSGECESIRLFPGDIDLESEGEKELDPALFKPDDESKYKLVVKAKAGEDPEPWEVEVKAESNWLTLVPKYESEYRFPKVAKSWPLHYAEIELQGFFKIEGKLAFDEGIVEAEGGAAKQGLGNELALEVGAKICECVLQGISTKLEVKPKAKFIVPFKSLKGLQFGETEDERTTYFKVALGIEVEAAPEKWKVEEEYGPIDFDGKQYGPVKLQGELHVKLEAELDLANISRETDIAAAKPGLPVEIGETELHGGLVFIGTVEAPNPFSDDDKKIKFEGAISGGPVVKLKPDWSAIFADAIKPLLAELTLDTVLVAGEAVAIYGVPILALGGAFYYDLIEPSAAWRDLDNMRTDFDAFRADFNKGFVEALVKAGTLEVAEDESGGEAQGRRMGNRYWKALFAKARAQMKGAPDQDVTNAVLWNVTKKQLLDEALQAIQTQLDSQMRHDFYMAFAHNHSQDNEDIQRDCVFIWLYGDIIDHHDYNISMPPHVPDDVLRQALKDAWYRHISGISGDATPRPDHPVGEPGDLHDALPQNAKGASSWNASLPGEVVARIPPHLPPDASLKKEDFVYIKQVDQVWPWPRADEYVQEDVQYIPKDLKLKKVTLNRWYERVQAPSPWLARAPNPEGKGEAWMEYGDIPARNAKK